MWSRDTIWRHRGAAGFDIDALAEHPITRSPDNIASTLEHSAAVGD